LFASGFICYNSYRIFNTLGEIMDEHLYDDLIESIRVVASHVEGIIDTSVSLRKSGMKYHVDLHAIVKATITVKEGHQLAHILKDTLQNEIQN
jgi:divalent metal cation (Fe/Co/Zn/Cd) transporter